MRKRILIFAFLTGLLVVLVFLKTSGSKGQEVKNVAAGIKASAEAKKKLIEENSKKYQPQSSSKTSESGLSLTAKSAIVVDEETNEILYQKNAKAQLPPASITKVLTLSVALEQFNPEELIEISESASGQISNKINMKPGEKLRTDDLLYGLMMISANDAAWALADAYPGGFEKFIERMNQKSKELGLPDSNFKNPAGLDDPEHHTSAFDMATYTRYALLEHPEFLKYAGKTKEHSVYATEHNEPHWWFGHLSAMLRRYPGMIAAKTGYTDEAKSTYIGVAERKGRKLVVVILGATDANNDVTALLNYGFAK